MTKCNLILIILLFSFSIYSEAYAFCSEPSEPYCAGSYGTFTDEFDFERCKRDVEDYLDDLRRYAICIADEVKNKQEEVVDNFNRKVQRTNNGY